MTSVQYISWCLLLSLFSTYSNYILCHLYRCLPVFDNIDYF